MKCNFNTFSIINIKQKSYNLYKIFTICTLFQSSHTALKFFKLPQRSVTTNNNTARTKTYFQNIYANLKAICI